MILNFEPVWRISWEDPPLLNTLWGVVDGEPESTEHQLLVGYLVHGIRLICIFASLMAGVECRHFHRRRRRRKAITPNRHKCAHSRHRRRPPYQRLVVVSCCMMSAGSLI